MKKPFLGCEPTVATRAHGDRANQMTNLQCWQRKCSFLPETHKDMKVLTHKDEVLSLKRHLSILLNFFFSIYRYLIFFFTFETSTLSNNRFAALVARKYGTISRQEKMTFSSSGRVALRLLSPYARAYADVRTKFSPINRLPKL